MHINRAKLVYYSPTGTSEKIVKAIQKGLNIDYDIINLTLPGSETKNYSFKPSNLAIIAAPVYRGRVAPVAAKRIMKLHGENTLSALVAVYGNRAYEDALLELKDITELNGFKRIAAGAFIGEHSFNSHETPIADGRPDTMDLNKATVFGARIRSKLADLTDFTDIQVPGNHPYREGWSTDRRSPDTDTETCTLCGICAEVCPTGCITVKDTVDTDPDECTTCSSCVKNCPTGARHWNNPSILKTAKWLASDYSERKEPETFL